jgi:hypothetical protein
MAAAAKACGATHKLATCPAMAPQSMATCCTAGCRQIPARTRHRFYQPVLDVDPVALQNRRLIATEFEAGFRINLWADKVAHFVRTRAA